MLNISWESPETNETYVAYSIEDRYDYPERDGVIPQPPNSIFTAEWEDGSLKSMTLDSGDAVRSGDIMVNGEPLTDVSTMNGQKIRVGDTVRFYEDGLNSENETYVVTWEPNPALDSELVTFGE